MQLRKFGSIGSILCFCSIRHLNQDDPGASLFWRFFASAALHGDVSVIIAEPIPVEDEFQLKAWLESRGHGLDGSIQYNSEEVRDATGLSVSVKCCRFILNGARVLACLGETNSAERESGSGGDPRWAIRLAAISERPDLIFYGDLNLVLAGKDEFVGLPAHRVVLLDRLTPIHESRAIAECCDEFVVWSEHVGTFLRSAYQFPVSLFAVQPSECSRRRESDSQDFLTFVDPTPGNGLFLFARIAEVLGRRRPDIPILVVEGASGEADVAACGLNLESNGNVFFHRRTRNPSDFWSRTRVCLSPLLARDTPPLVAVEALINQIPVIGSDRGGLPETISEGGRIIALPDHWTSAVTVPPSERDVEPWVQAVIDLWGDPVSYEKLREGTRNVVARLEPWNAEKRVFSWLEKRIHPSVEKSISVSSSLPPSIVLVPYMDRIEPECEQALLELERRGIRVWRRPGSSGIDLARSDMTSRALREGYENIMFIDSDIGFAPEDALRLVAMPEAVVSGVYSKKGHRELASQFDEHVATIRFGPDSPGLYPLKYAATGFLRIKSGILRRMIDELNLPLCNKRWSNGFWPFFLPLIIEEGEHGPRYLGEDWAFSHRLSQIGVVPLADTTIRLWHFGRYPYGWEDAGTNVRRFPSYDYRIVSGNQLL